MDHGICQILIENLMMNLNRLESRDPYFSISMLYLIRLLNYLTWYQPRNNLICSIYNINLYFFLFLLLRFRSVSKLGISNDDSLVIYDGMNLFSSCRVYWTFKYFGHKNVAVLNGVILSIYIYIYVLGSSSMEVIRLSNRKWRSVGCKIIII